MIEALASNTPLIATKTGVAPDLSGKYCKLYDFGNKNQLKKNISDTLSDRKQINSFEYIKKNYSWDSVVNKTRMLYENKYHNI